MKVLPLQKDVFVIYFSSNYLQLSAPLNLILVERDGLSCCELMTPVRWVTSLLVADEKRRCVEDLVRSSVRLDRQIPSELKRRAKPCDFSARDRLSQCIVYKDGQHKSSLSVKPKHPPSVLADGTKLDMKTYTCMSNTFFFVLLIRLMFKSSFFWSVWF